MASPGSIVIQAVVDSTKAARDAAKLAMSLGKVDTEADNLDTALKGAQRAMDSTGNTSRDTATDLGRTETALDSVGDEADALADRLRVSANQMAAEVKNASGDIETQAGGMKASMGDLGAETGAEFIGNIAEGIGSGQANLADVVSGTLGGVTNLAATLGGPLGLAAGAAAAGIGLVFGAAKAEADKAHEQVQNLIDKLGEVADVSSAAAKQIIWDEWLATMKESPEQLNKIVSALDAAGISSEVWREAITGNVDAQAQVNKQLTETGLKIIDNVNAGKPLTQQQQDYLENSPLIREELRKQGVNLDEVESIQADINRLQRGAKDGAHEWGREVGGVRTEAQRTKDILDALDGKDVRVDFVANYSGKESDWNPAARAAGQSSSAMVAGRAAPVTNVTINMQGAFNDPLGNARHIKRLLEQGDLRQGRPRGAPLAVAWG